MKYLSLPCLVFLSLTIAPQGQPQGQDRSELEQVEGWQKALQTAFANVKQPVLYDVDLKLTPTGAPIQAGRPDQLPLYGAVNRRLHGVVAGVSVFRRGWVPGDSILEGADSKLIKWLRQLSPQARKELCGKGMALSELDGRSQMLLAGLAGRMESPVSGPISSGQYVNVSVRLMPVVEYTDPTTGRTVKQPLPTSYPDSVRDAAARAVVHSRIPDEPPLNSSTVASGPLQFPVGQVIKLPELLKQATEKFGSPYQFDGRLRDAYVYVSGSYNQKSFETAIRALCATQAPEPVSNKPLDKRAAIAELLGGGLADALDEPALTGGKPSNEAFVNGSSLSASEVAASNPFFAGVMSRFGLTGNASVRLSAGIAVVIWAEGFSPVPGSSGTMNGIPVAAVQPNRLMYGIKP